MQQEGYNYSYWPEGGIEHPSRLLSLNERDRRWKKIREEMKRRGLDCLVTYDGPQGVAIAGLSWYITNAHGLTDAKVLFPKDGNPILFPWAETQEDLAKKLVWPGIDVVVGGWGIPEWTIANQIKERGYERGAVGIAGLSDYVFLGGWVPHTSYTFLQRFLPEAQMEDATNIMTDIKLIKSEEELKLIKKASEIGDKAIETMVRYAKPGVMEQEVWAKIMYTTISEGCDAGINGSTHIMAIGDNYWQASVLLKHHMIKEGDVILTEFYPKYGGYVSHPNQPVFIGKVNDEYEKCYQILLESIQEGLRTMTVEHTWMEVAEAFARPVREAGMWSTQTAAHGLSLSYPDPPHVPMPGCERRKVDKQSPGSLIEQVPELEFISCKKMDLLNRRVEPNIVLGIEPKVCMGNRGLHMGPTVVTTEGRPSILTQYGRDIIRV